LVEFEVMSRLIWGFLKEWYLDVEDLKDSGGELDVGKKVVTEGGGKTEEGGKNGELDMLLW
jgi:hypothetical protein